MKNTIKIFNTRFILFIALFLMSILSLFIGVVDITPLELFQGNLKQLQIFFASRLPRLLAVLCTGFGLSIAGLIMQQLCMNKFISPSTGATISSAQFGILIALICVPESNLVTKIIFSFISAIIGTYIFVLFIQKIQFKDIIMVPLIGIMFSYVIDGITSYFAYKYQLTQTLSSWLTGHFSLIIRGRYEIVYLVIPMIIISFLFSNHFNIIGMGKDFSSNLGVPYNLILFLGLGIAAIITASTVVVVGSIPYIGLIVPNIVSMFKGDKIEGTLIDTALFGGLFLLFCDIISRIIIPPYEIPIALISGILGSIIFIVLLIYKLKHGTKSVKSIIDKGFNFSFLKIGKDYDKK